MAASKNKRLRELFDRISRITAAEERADDLNPAQRSALAYLSRANRFSRAPSNVADYLCATRGTASQTLKALERKGLVAQKQSPDDKRSIAYEVTKKGRNSLGKSSNFDAALGTLKSADTDTLVELLEITGRTLLERQGFKTFGLCKTCIHHRQTDQGLACALLQVPLSAAAANEICCEHEPGSGTDSGAA